MSSSEFSKALEAAGSGEDPLNISDLSDFGELGKPPRPQTTSPQMAEPGLAEQDPLAQFAQQPLAAQPAMPSM